MLRIVIIVLYVVRHFKLAVLGSNKYLPIVVERSIKIWLKDYLDQLGDISVSQHPLLQIRRNLPLHSRKEKVN